jgi:hypothetical protein
MNKDNLIEFAKEQCEIFPEDSYMGEYLRKTLKMLQAEPCEDCISREAVLDTLDKMDSVLDEGRTVETYKELLIACYNDLPPVKPTQRWIPLVWDEYPTVDSDGNDDYVYAVDYSVPMPKEDEWVLITDVNHNVVTVQYDGYDFGDYARENILAWSPLPQPYEEK